MRKSTVLLLAALCLAPFAQAQNTLAGNLTVQQTVKLTGAASPAQLTANVNDYAPAGFSTAAVLRLQSDVPRTITGLAGGAAGRMVWLTNVGTQTISLATESALSTAANRFAFGASGFDLPAGGSLSIWYDTTSSRWRAATNLAAGGGGTTIDQTARDAAASAQATADSKQAALANATTLAKVTEAAGLPLWDGAAWPGGGSGGTGTVTSVSVVTANGVSGSVANASTTPAITISLGAITPASVAASGAVTGSNLSGINTGDQTSVTGNAGTATKLATARTINGVSFDGTAAITVPAAAGTLTGATLAAGVTSSSLTSAAGGTFGTAAFTSASAYDPAGAAAAITLAGLGGVPTTRTVNGHALSGNVSVSASDVGLGAVENTALSAWSGSANLATVGTVTAGTWAGSAIADAYISSAAAWNAKVSFPGFGTTGTTAAVGNDARLSDARTPTAHNQAWSTITSTPTTLSGYGITDAQPLDSDLTSIAALATDAFGRDLLTKTTAANVRTYIGAGTSSFDGAFASLSSKPTTLSGYGITDAQGLDADLTAVAGLSTAGLVARTGAGTAAARTITGTADQVIVANGDGVGGNPKLALPQSIATGSTPTFAGLIASSGDVIVGGTTQYGDTSVAGRGLFVQRETTNAHMNAVVAGYNRSATFETHGSFGTLASPTAVQAYLGAGRFRSKFFDGTSWGTAGQMFIRPEENWTTSSHGSSMHFSTVTNGSLPDDVRMTIQQNGNVGIGTMSPGARLEVNMNDGQSSTTTGLYVFDSANVGCFVADLRSNLTDDNGGDLLRVRNASGNAILIKNNRGLQLAAYGAGTLVTDSSGNVTASSDASLKNVTGNFTRGLADVLKLTPRTYRWNDKSGMNTWDDNVGFIAQEVLGAVPEAVGQYRTTESDVDGKKTKKREKAELLTLSDRPIIAALVNAVKELKAENDTLSDRLSKLEGKK